MQDTLFNVLTNEQARSENNVQNQLDQEFAAGAPWFD